MKKRVYTLYRVSTKGQVEKDDIPMQKEACRNFAESQGWEIVKEFSEKGVSGFKKSAKERDELQKIQQAAMEGKFDILLVFMFDRLGRRDDETPFIVEWFTKQGIEVWSVNEGQQRFDTHVDKLMNYIRYWQASGESLKTSVRTRTRLEQLTGEGHYTGGTVPFGYKRVRLGRVNKKNQEVCDLVIDEAEAEIVRLIFHKYVYEGYGAQKLSHYLYEQGAVGRNNKNIPNTSIVRMIKNKGYTGYLINGAVETECPQLRIIEPELFEQAQELRQARTCERGGTSLGTSSKALLTGLVYCAHCGNRLSLTSSGRTHTYADGHTVKEVRPRYSCFYKIRHPGDCDGQSGYGVSKLDSIVRSCPADLRTVPGGFPEEAAGIGQDQRCRPNPEENQGNPERLGSQAERTGRPESRNHPGHSWRKHLGQRTAWHTGGRSKRGTGNPGKAARAGTGRIRGSHQNSKA
mgnify:CR=1 FL=1